MTEPVNHEIRLKLSNLDRHYFLSMYRVNFKEKEKVAHNEKDLVKMKEKQVRAEMPVADKKISLCAR
jgi:hypothetical protein